MDLYFQRSDYNWLFLTEDERTTWSLRIDRSAEQAWGYWLLEGERMEAKDQELVRRRVSGQWHLEDCRLRLWEPKTPESYADMLPEASEPQPVWKGAWGLRRDSVSLRLLGHTACDSLSRFDRTILPRFALRTPTPPDAAPHYWQGRAEDSDLEREIYWLFEPGTTTVWILDRTPEQTLFSAWQLNAHNDWTQIARRSWPKPVQAALLPACLVVLDPSVGGCHWWRP